LKTLPSVHRNRHESDLKDNVYWLGLLTHLQVRCWLYRCLLL